MKPPAPNGGKLFDLISVPLLGLVFLCFFLPLVDFNCQGETIRFSGTNLTLGTDPTFPPAMEDMRSREKQQARSAGVDIETNEDTDKEAGTNLLFLLVPLGAAAGAWMAWQAYQNGKFIDGPLLKVVPTVLTVLFLYYAIFGFTVERQVVDERKKMAEQSEMPIPISMSTEKTNWYWFAFLCAAGATGLAFMRDKSPLMPNQPAPGFPVETDTPRDPV